MGVGIGFDVLSFGSALGGSVLGLVLLGLHFRVSVLVFEVSSMARSLRGSIIGSRTGAGAVLVLGPASDPDSD
jgi:hypothetical protein